MSLPPQKQEQRNFSSSEDMRGSVSVSSLSSSRNSLRQSISERRRALTRQESQFLETLCDTGGDVEVQLAHRRLLDNDLFFDSEEVCSNNGNESKSSREPSTSLSSMDGRTSEGMAPANPKPGLNQRQASLSSIGTNQGSDLRLSMLESRRSSQLFGNMWKAHENGLAVSGGSSRKSFMMRRNSSLGTSRRSLMKTEQNMSSIFRANRRRSSSDAKPFDSKSDMGSRRPSIKKFPPRSQLSRLDSVGSRKSVTFGILPESPRKSLRASDEFGSSVLKGVTTRSDSISSIPSLHMATSVHSSASMPSLPPITKASRVFSDGSIKSIAMSDITSADGTREGRDPSDTLEEKKSEDNDAPIPAKVEIPPMVGKATSDPPIRNAVELLQHEPILRRPVLLREASQNIYGGAGVEITDFEALADSKSPLNIARQMDSLVAYNDNLSRSNSFDETVSVERLHGIFRRSSISFLRSLSDDESNPAFPGRRPFLSSESSFANSLRQAGPLEESDSWQMDEDDDMDYYDSWMAIEDEYDGGYGGPLDFFILGTSADDISAHPHVLSPPLMESLQSFLPSSKSGQNFWMKYSMVRDGSSMITFLQHARGCKHSIIAIETVDGEVFGCFTGEAWRKNWNYFGTGESFLWRMRHTRQEKSHSILDQAKMESEIDVFPYTSENSSIQLCTHDMIAVGGGNWDASMPRETGVVNHGSPIKQHEWGFGLTIKSDMLTGTSSPCITFGSPSLSEAHSDGSLFEIVNVELWTLTPCMLLEDAEKLELGKLFLQQHSV